MRIVTKSDYGYSSFFLAYVRQPRNVVGELDEEIISIEELDRYEKVLFSRIENIIFLKKNIISRTRQNIKKYKIKMIEHFNKKAKNITYRVDDLVMVLERNRSALSSILLPKWYGPFRIKEVVGQDVYIVKDGEMRLPYAFHASKLKMYKSRPRLSASSGFYSKVNSRP